MGRQVVMIMIAIRYKRCYCKSTEHTSFCMTMGLTVVLLAFLALGAAVPQLPKQHAGKFIKNLQRYFFRLYPLLLYYILFCFI